MPVPPDERHIIGRVMLGDAQAVEMLVRQFGPRIRRAVQEARVPPIDIDDVVQDVTVEAVRQLSAGRFEQKASLRTWLRHITHGRIVDYWRAAARRGLGKVVSLEAVDGRLPEFLTEASQEALLLTEEALATMPPRHQLAIRAHCREGLPIGDLARLFGLSVDRTRGIVTEAKRMFRRHVRGNEKRPVPRRLKK